MNQAKEFDWVAALQLCSTAEVFARLRSQVKKDVETRELWRKSKETAAHYSFRFVSNNGEFTALVAGNGVHLSVIFALDMQGITIRDGNDKSMFTATTTLNDEGECRLKVDGQEREFWQVRKMALESLLFGVY